MLKKDAVIKSLLEELEKLMKGREQKDGAPMKEKFVF